MSVKKVSLDSVGAELVQEARSQSEESLPLSTRLFPYVLIASRRMSLRKISAWLEDKHGVSMSAGTISRSLNKPELHLERLSEFIAPVARYVGTAYHVSATSLLFDKVSENGPSALHVMAEHDHKSPENEEDIDRWGELQFLASVWEPIPDEVQQMLAPYLRYLVDPEETQNPFEKR